MSDRAGKRTFIEDIRRNGEYLRVSWHADKGCFVISNWTDNVCTGATQVAPEDVPQLISHLANGLGEAMQPASTPTTPPAQRSRWSIAGAGRRFRAELQHLLGRRAA